MGSPSGKHFSSFVKCPDLVCQFHLPIAISARDREVLLPLNGPPYFILKILELKLVRS